MATETPAPARARIAESITRRTFLSMSNASQESKHHRVCIRRKYCAKMQPNVTLLSCNMEWAPHFRDGVCDRLRSAPSDTLALGNALQHTTPFDTNTRIQINFQIEIAKFDISVFTTTNVRVHRAGQSQGALMSTREAAQRL